MGRILIVEDDPASAEVLSILLRKLGGHDPRVCDVGDEVVRAAQSGEADAVVMDVSLRYTMLGGAKVDGLILTRILKGSSASARIPVLLVSAHAMRGDDVRFLAESGAQDYVSKPITDFADFVRRVDRLLTMAAPTRPLARHPD